MKVQRDPIKGTQKELTDLTAKRTSQIGKAKGGRDNQQGGQEKEEGTYQFVLPTWGSTDDSLIVE